MTRKLITLTALASTIALGVGCSSVPDNPAPTYGGVGTSTSTYPSTSSYESVQYGTVRDIHQREIAQRRSGAGALLGAVIGGVAGNQVGSGTGRAAATAIGAVGGAVIGDRIEANRNNNNTQSYYQVDVRMDNGEMRTFDYADINGLRVGDRVRIQDNQLQRW
jgi:outer membrane lipoprotein SlyB